MPPLTVALATYSLGILRTRGMSQGYSACAPQKDAAHTLLGCQFAGFQAWRLGTRSMVRQNQQAFCLLDLVTVAEPVRAVVRVQAVVQVRLAVRQLAVSVASSVSCVPSPFASFAGRSWFRSLWAR